MANVKSGYQDSEYDLRQVQASKRAIRLVAEGIEHFKAGRHTDAFNCLTSALQIDPNNVEGLVARGALYANSGNFEKAISDFETALKLNQNHGNARKYLGETLVAYGRNLEEEKKFDDAKRMYLHCLSLIPTHEEAKMSLDYLKNRLSMETIEPNVVIETDSLLPPNFASLSRPKLNQEFHNSKSSAVAAAVAAAAAAYEDKTDNHKKKSKKGKKRKHRARSSSSSSSSSSSRSSSSSSTSSSKSSSSSTDESEYKRKRKKSTKSRKHDRKNASPSPFTKKIEEFANLSQYAKSSKDIDYELKVRAFLEQTKNSPNFEDHVRKFLLESAKLKQQQQSQLKQLQHESPTVEKKKHKKHKHEKKKRDKDNKRKKKNDEKQKKDLSDSSKKKNSKNIFDLHHETSKKLLESMDSYEDFESKFSALHAVAQKKNDIQSSQEKHDVKKSSMGMQEVQKSRYQRNSEQKHSEELEASHEKSKKNERNELILQEFRLKSTPSTSSNVAALQTNMAPSSGNTKNVPQPVILDKFGNFRLITEKDVPENILVQDRLLNEKSKKDEKRMSRSKSRSRSRSRSRSHSRKRRRRSSSSSKSRRSRRSRSRGRSTRSGSRSYSHSRSRSRSSSGEHHNYRNRRAVRGNWNDRGTYYKPRYYNNYNNRGRGNQMNNRNYRGGGGGGWGNRPYNNRNYRNNNNSMWTYRANNNNNVHRNNRRHEHSYSKSRSRSKSMSAGSNWSDEQDSTMRKVNEEKDKINKFLDNENKSAISAERNSKDKVSDHEGNELFV